MNRRSILVLCSLVLAAPAFAAHKKSKPAPAPSPAATPGAPSDQMQKAMQLGQPSENHKALAPLVGDFDYTATMWMTPGAQPMVSSGTSTQTLVFGGRFLRQDVTGNMGPGAPFEGVGYLGYDNIRGEYQSVWMGNMTTGMMIGTGTRDANGVFQQSGTVSCPMTGEKNHAFRTELRVDSPDKMVYTSYDKDASGREFKSMEIVYTRRK